jgi:hypothetical protein
MREKKKTKYRNQKREKLLMSGNFLYCVIYIFLPFTCFLLPVTAAVCKIFTTDLESLSAVSSTGDETYLVVHTVIQCLRSHVEVNQNGF